MRTKNLHYFSGITISVFIIFHLVNHLYSLFGADIHIQFMNNFRLLYRNLVAEFVLIFAVGIQIISGIKLFLNKRKVASSFFEKLQLYTGLYLVLFFIIHLTAIFFGRFILKLDTNFYFGVAGLNTFPLSLFFVPYYAFAIISFFGHIAAIHSMKMKHIIFGVNPKAQSKLILIFGILLALMILYGLTNNFEAVEIPKDYKIILGE